MGGKVEKNCKRFYHAIIQNYCVLCAMYCHVSSYLLQPLEPENVYTINSWLHFMLQSHSVPPSNIRNHTCHCLLLGLN